MAPLGSVLPVTPYGQKTFNPHTCSLIKKLPYDPLKDFAPITLVAVLPQIFPCLRHLRPVENVARKAGITAQ